MKQRGTIQYSACQLSTLVSHCAQWVPGFLHTYLLHDHQLYSCNPFTHKVSRRSGNAPRRTCSRTTSSTATAASPANSSTGLSPSRSVRTPFHHMSFLPSPHPSLACSHPIPRASHADFCILFYRLRGVRVGEEARRVAKQQGGSRRGWPRRALNSIECHPGTLPVL